MLTIQTLYSQQTVVEQTGKERQVHSWNKQRHIPRLYKVLLAHCTGLYKYIHYPVLHHLAEYSFSGKEQLYSNTVEIQQVLDPQNFPFPLDND